MLGLHLVFQHPEKGSQYRALCAGPQPFASQTGKNKPCRHLSRRARDERGKVLMRLCDPG
jgi:hypothetical protein